LAYLLWMINWVKFASFVAGNNTEFRTEDTWKLKNLLHRGTIAQSAVDYRAARDRMTSKSQE